MEDNLITSEKVNFAMETKDIDHLFNLAAAYPTAFWGKISIRYAGKKRLNELYNYLLGQKNTFPKRSFEILLLRRLEDELGVGMFR